MGGGGGSFPMIEPRGCLNRPAAPFEIAALCWAPFVLAPSLPLSLSLSSLTPLAFFSFPCSALFLCAHRGAGGERVWLAHYRPATPAAPPLPGRGGSVHSN